MKKTNQDTMKNMIQPIPSGHIRVQTGHAFDPFNAQESDIHLIDIVQGLSTEYRFGGHMKTPLTVAEHSMVVARFAPSYLELEALLHDASEAYIKDMPSPLKDRLPDYQRYENQLQEVIFSAFGLDNGRMKDVKPFDRKAKDYEWERFVMKKTQKPIGSTPSEVFTHFAVRLTGAIQTRLDQHPSSQHNIRLITQLAELRNELPFYAAACQ